ncbi:MAG: ABC transporter permease [Dehalococcoidia bacterium]
MLWRFWTLSRTAYVGLYDPGTPLAFLVNIAIRPGFTLLTFGYLVATVADGAVLRDAVLGAAVLTLNWPTLGGALQTVGYELGNGTLGFTLASPVARGRLLASRGLIHIPNGLLAFAAAATIGSLVFRLDLGGVNWLGVAGSVLVISVSLTALGLLLGIGSLKLREVWALLGVASVTLYVLSGAIIPLDTLHPAAQAAASVVPTRWGVEGMHRALDGDGIATVAPYWLAEVGVGAAVFMLAIGALRLYELDARRRGSVDLI